MSKKLPQKDFRWMNREQLDSLNILDYDDNGDDGLVLEVDLLYPQHLFEKHQDLPLAPDNIEITKDMLYPETENFLDKHNIKFITQKRLAPNFLPKKKYVVHASCLKFYVEQGLIVEHIHRGVIFKQSHWLKPYIDMNTAKRQQATSEFEKSFYKLLVIFVIIKNLLFNI